MQIEGLSIVERFLRKNALARKPIAVWLEKTEAAIWSNFVDVKNTFNSVDYKKPYVIFDIGGNNYRILAQVDYRAQTIVIIKIDTHKEYLRWKL